MPIIRPNVAIVLTPDEKTLSRLSKQERQELVADRLAIASWKPREDIVASIQLLQLLVLEHDVLLSQAGKRVGHRLLHLLHKSTNVETTPIACHAAWQIRSAGRRVIYDESIVIKIWRMMAHAHAVSTRPSFPLPPLEGLGTRLILDQQHLKRKRTKLQNSIVSPPQTTVTQTSFR